MTGRGKIEEKLFELAEIAKMDEEERSKYEDSLKDYRDLKSAIDTYYKDGRTDKAKEIALELLKEGLPISLIAKTTGLSEGEIKEL